MTRIRFDGCDLSPERGTPVPPRLASAGWLPRRTLCSCPKSCSRARSSHTAARSRPRAARTAPLPAALDPRVRAAIGVGELYAHQLAGLGGRRAAGSTSSSRPARPRARRWPSTSPCSTRSRAIAEATGCSTSIRPRRSRRISSERSTRSGVPRLRPAIYDGDTPTEQRRQIRKSSNAILTNPDMVHIGLLPNHERWGEVLANLALRRGRRGARLPRRLRLARRERPAAAAPDRADLRLRAAVPARHGNDLEPGRARHRAPRHAGDRDRRRCRAAGRAHGRALEPAAPRRRARPPRLGPRRGGQAPGRTRRARPAHAHLREEPQGGRADPPLHRRAARRRLAALALPRRLHGRAAARDRAAPRRRASCSASPRPTRSSSGSTSGCSTP